MKIYRSSNNFTSKIDIEPALDPLRNLVDHCLDAAQNRSDPKAEPPAEAWFEIESDGYRLSIGMRSLESNYVFLSKGAPEEPQKRVSKGVLGFLKAFARANFTDQEITVSLSKDQVVSFMAIVLTDDLEKITSFLQPHAL